MTVVLVSLRRKHLNCWNGSASTSDSGVRWMAVEPRGQRNEQSDVRACRRQGEMSGKEKLFVVLM